MNAEPSFQTAICKEYESLLVACQEARELWRKRRKEIRRLAPKSMETPELLCLQADYAKRYSRLKKHQDKCELCRLSEVGSCNYASISMLS
jgi:hypothetical protein